MGTRVPTLVDQILVQRELIFLVVSVLPVLSVCAGNNSTVYTKKGQHRLFKAYNGTTKN